ncbi:MAG: FHA domain-containing protein [Isosphaeraceae bacterium]
MKVQLVVVRGKPEGKVIPLAGSNFKIGRGETCHLRPNSEQVSREHAEFIIKSDAVIVRDLGSRNGTLVNGKALTTEPCTLKDRDLVQVGPLTFAVSIQDAPAAKAAPAAAAPEKPKAKAASPDDISTDDIDSWLLGDNASQTADQPTAVYGGDTITITAFKDAQQPAAANKPPSVVDDSEYERQTEDEEREETAELDEEQEEEQEEQPEEEQEEEEEAEDEAPAEEEFMDPQQPLLRRQEGPEGSAPRRLPPARAPAPRRRPSRTAPTRPTRSSAN